MTTDIDKLIAEARKWAANAPFIGRSTYRELDRGILNVRKLADALEATAAELRKERERADDGSCWDDGPQMRTPGGCDPMPPKCELRAGHQGAHQGGGAEWMRNPASFNQAVRERDAALADLARAREVITLFGQILGDPKYGRDSEWVRLNIQGAVAAYNAREQNND